MANKYDNLVKELTFTDDEFGYFKKTFLVEKDFLTYEHLSIRVGICDKPGSIIEEVDAMHTHDYEQLLLFFSSDLNHMLELGGEVEVAIGETGERHKFTIPTAVAIPKGMPHFSPRVISASRDIFFVSLSNAPAVKADVYPTDLKPDSGPLARMRSPYSKYCTALKWQSKDGYLYGSEAYEFSGGFHTAFTGDSVGVPFLITWQSIFLAHTMGPRTPKLTHVPHVHPFDELVVLLSADSNDLEHLGGEIEMSLGKEAEVHLVDKPGITLYPAHVPHTPNVFRQPWRPYIFFVICCSGSHETDTNEGNS